MYVVVCVAREPGRVTGRVIIRRLPVVGMVATETVMRQHLATSPHARSMAVGATGTRGLPVQCRVDLEL